mgnify:FL=1
MLYVQCTLMGVLENSFPSKQSKAVKMNRFTLIRLLKELKKKKNTCRNCFEDHTFI